MIIILRLNPKVRPRVDMSLFYFNNKGVTHSDLFNIIVYQLIICIINVCVFFPLCVFFSRSLVPFGIFSDTKHEIYLTRPKAVTTPCLKS